MFYTKHFVSATKLSHSSKVYFNPAEHEVIDPGMKDAGPTYKEGRGLSLGKLGPGEEFQGCSRPTV